MECVSCPLETEGDKQEGRSVAFEVLADFLRAFLVGDRESECGVALLLVADGACLSDTGAVSPSLFRFLGIL